MPVTRTCTFCGNDIEPGTGKMFIRKDGTINFFCSSKCQKNLSLGRIGRRVQWTRRYVKALQVRPPRRAEVAAPARVAEAETVEEKEAVVKAFAEIPGVRGAMAEALWESGFTSVEKLREADESALTDVKGIGPATAKKIVGHLKEGD